jgi:hypothetical protein
MVEHPRSAAASIYPNLPHDDGRQADWAMQRRERNDIASAMFPALVPSKPAPPNRHSASTDVSLAALCDENPWIEQGLAMAGLIRKR